MKRIVKETQWVMIAPDSLLENQDEDSSFCKMPHPQNGVENLFLFKNGKSYQLMKCEDPCRSWFINDSVQKDGSMFIVTPIDPLFLALPYLEKFLLQDKFTTLDNMLVDEKYPLAMVKLEESLTKGNLLNICYCKGSDDLTVYKADKSKILAWLSLKIQKTASHLSKSNVHVAMGSKVANFVQVSNEEKLKDDCLRYGWNVISDYITDKWSLELKESLSIKDVLKEVKQAAKKQKLNDSTACDTKPAVVTDYRDHSKINQKKKAAVKLTSVQKSLQKVDKKGMKKMSSFFTSKPKK